MQQQSNSRRYAKTRRSLLLVGTLSLLYPLLRFIHFAVPRKPRSIEISTELPASGVLATGELILFDRNNESWAVSRTCTHLGCKLNFHEQGDYLECPCHQSRFTLDGKVLRGPAKEHLAIYPVTKRDTVPFYTITV